MNYSRFPCLKPSHEKAALQYICTNPKCVKNCNFIGCIHCGKDEHREHMDNVMAIKVFINTVHQTDKQVEDGLQDIKEKRNQLQQMLKGLEEQIAKIEARKNRSKE
jgi:septal ring factor EnvC (AmiA/AmiB activator)